MPAAIDRTMQRLALRIVWSSGLFSQAELAQLFGVSESFVYETIRPFLSASAQKVFDAEDAKPKALKPRVVRPAPLPPKKKAWRKLSLEQQEKAVRLYSEGLKVPAIAREVGAQYQTVLNTLKRLKVY